MPILESIDPYGETRLLSAVVGRLMAECARALMLAKDGPKRRGILRLRLLAHECSKNPNSALF